MITMQFRCIVLALALLSPITTLAQQEPIEDVWLELGVGVNGEIAKVHVEAGDRVQPRGGPGLRILAAADGSSARRPTSRGLAVTLRFLCRFVSLGLAGDLLGPRADRPAGRRAFKRFLWLFRKTGLPLLFRI